MLWYEWKQNCKAELQSLIIQTACWDETCCYSYLLSHYGLNKKPSYHTTSTTNSSTLFFSISQHFQRGLCKYSQRLTGRVYKKPDGFCYSGELEIWRRESWDSLNCILVLRETTDLSFGKSAKKVECSLFLLMTLFSHTSTHIGISKLGCVSSLPLENERGVKFLEIFVLGEYNSKQCEDNCKCCQRVLLHPLVATKINSVKLKD